MQAKHGVRGSTPATNPVGAAHRARPGSDDAAVRVRRVALYLVRLAAGPLALAGFFLPWAEGPGVLSASEFTGFRLLSFAGRLEQLDLSLIQTSELWLARVALLGVVIAAAWHTALAPAHRWHVFYTLSGWYLVVVFAGALALGAARSGLVLPPLGLALSAGGALLFALSELADHAFGGAREQRSR